MTKLLKIVKNSFLLLILFYLVLYKGVIISVLGNVMGATYQDKGKQEAEIKILKEKVSYLEDEYKKVTDLKQYAKYNYKLARLSYRAAYDAHKIMINIGKNENVQENYPLFNQFGLVGIINKVKEDYSEATLLTGVTNLSVTIGDAYGTLTSYENGLFVLENLSNYDKISLNDMVYTSTLGVIKEKIPIGLVYQIEEEAIEKKVYVKSNVDFNKIHYVFVIGDV